MPPTPHHARAASTVLETLLPVNPAPQDASTRWDKPLLNAAPYSFTCHTLLLCTPHLRPTTSTKTVIGEAFFLFFRSSTYSSLALFASRYSSVAFFLSKTVTGKQLFQLFASPDSPASPAIDLALPPIRLSRLSNCSSSISRILKLCRSGYSSAIRLALSYSKLCSCVNFHGLEYGFGAHDFPSSGVFEVEPRNCPGFIYRCSILLGYIHMSSQEFRTFLESVIAEYNGDTYHLISKNCNHFTEDISLKLTGNQIPRWVNRLAGLGAACNCLLPESLRLPSVKQSPEYHAISEDGSESVAFINVREPMDSDDTDKDKFLLSLQSKCCPQMNR